MNIMKLFGLSEHHNAIYMTLLEYGRLQPASIAKITSIKRPTVYLLLKELEERGFVRQDIRENHLAYLPTPPEELNKIFADEERKLNEKKKEFLNTLPTLVNSVKGRNYSDPKIRMIGGGEIEKYLYDNLALWLEKVTETPDKTWWGFQDASFVDQYEKWIHWSWSTAPKELHLNLLTNKVGAEKDMKGKYLSQRHMKYLNKAEFNATEWVMGDRIVYFMTKQKPSYAIEVVDPIIAANTATVFKLLWDRI
jgi:predicted transcriptional regulator